LDLVFFNLKKALLLSGNTAGSIKIINQDLNRLPVPYWKYILPMESIMEKSGRDLDIYCKEKKRSGNYLKRKLFLTTLQVHKEHYSKGSWLKPEQGRADETAIENIDNGDLTSARIFARTAQSNVCRPAGVWRGPKIKGAYVDQTAAALLSLIADNELLQVLTLELEAGATDI